MWCDLAYVKKPRSNPEKKRKEIEKLQAKDKSWLAEKLFAARGDLSFTLSEYSKGSKDNETLKKEIRILRGINANMAEVLKDHGLLPTQYIVKYGVCDCENCEAHRDDEGEGESCDDSWPYDETCPKRIDIKTLSLWAFDLKNSFLGGIQSDFLSCELEGVVSISTANGLILYEKENADEEDTDKEDTE